MSAKMLKEILDGVKKIEKQQEEDHRILKALEHRANTSSAEIESIAVNLAKLTGNVTKLSAERTMALDFATINRLDIKDLNEKFDEILKKAE